MTLSDRRHSGGDAECWGRLPGKSLTCRGKKRGAPGGTAHPCFNQALGMGRALEPGGVPLQYEYSYGMYEYVRWEMTGEGVEGVEGPEPPCRSAVGDPRRWFTPLDGCVLYQPLAHGPSAAPVTQVSCPS